MKKTRAERDASLWANEEFGQATAKKDTDLKKTRTKLTKAQAYVTEYLMKEEELVWEVAKAKDEVECMRNEFWKHTGKINSLQRRLKHVKKEQKIEATAFEQQLWKLRQELRDGEKTWSEKEKKFWEEAVQLTTNIRKLKAELEDHRKKNGRMKSELNKKDNGIKELRTQ